MKLRRHIILFFMFIVSVGMGENIHAEEKRKWLILETKQDGLPVIVRAVDTLPDVRMRHSLPWRITVDWRFEPKKNGLPTESTLQLGRGIEDGLVKVMEEKGNVDLPLTRTGNGLRRWYFYVQDPKVVEAPIRKFFGNRSNLSIAVKASRDEDWTTLREVLEKVRQSSNEDI